MDIRVTPLLPRMAWILRRTGSTTVVHAGEGVQHGPDWLFEGGWAYTDHPGKCSITGIYLGSGLVFHESGSFTAISPSHTCESIFAAVSKDSLVVGNSMALVLATMPSTKINVRELSKRLETIKKGLAEYDTIILQNDQFSLHRYAHNNVSFGLAGEVKPVRQRNPRGFESYEGYLHFLTNVIRSAEVTGRTSGRTVPLSKGYDSVACASLAARLGGGDSFSVLTSRDDLRDDSGEPIGRQLGLSTHAISRPVREFEKRAVNYSNEKFRRQEVIPDEELHSVAEYFSGMGVSDEVLRIPEHLARNRTILTGFQGDAVWGFYPPTTDIVRTDVSGTGLTERRLRSGFIHIPIPMIGAQDHPDILAISNSRVMNRWRVGGKYDRPIPRRMAEEMGVDRASFGRSKTAVSTIANNQKDIAPILLNIQMQKYSRTVESLQNDRSSNEQATD